MTALLLHERRAHPAILNAIHDATGVRVYEIPVDPKRLLAGMRAH